MSRVADQEAASLRVALSQLGGEGEGAQPFDLRPEGAGAGGALDETGQVVPAKAGQPARACGDLAGQRPPVTGPAGSQYARRVGPGDQVQGVAVLAGQLPQRGGELDALIVGQVVGAEHGDSELLADGAVRPVGGDQVGGADVLDASGPGAGDGGTDTAPDLIAASSPNRRISSIPQVLMTRLRDSPGGVLRLPISTTSMPYRARVMAATSPPGPAPATRTSQVRDSPAVVSQRPAPQSMAAGGCPLPVMAGPPF